MKYPVELKVKRTLSVRVAAIASRSRVIGGAFGGLAGFASIGFGTRALLNTCGVDDRLGGARRSQAARAMNEPARASLLRNIRVGQPSIGEIAAGMVRRPWAIGASRLRLSCWLPASWGCPVLP